MSTDRAPQSRFPKAALALALGWLIPGLGHYLLGKRLKATIFFSAILGCYAAGYAISEGHAVQRYDHPYSYWAQLGVGGPTLLLTQDDAPTALQPGYRQSGQLVHPLVPGLDLGLLYTMIAGLLNFLAAADAYDQAR